MRASRLASHAVCALFACALAGPLVRAAAAQPSALHGDESVATTDDARALFGNPAGIGVRYPDELLVGWARREAAHEWSSGLLTLGSMGLFATREPFERRSWGYGLASGDAPLRVGWSTTWRSVRRPTRETVADHRLGLLSRPTPWLSVGATADHLAQPTLLGVRAAREYTFGVALRPIALDRARAWALGPRLTLSADASLAEGEDAGSARVRVAAELEPFPGLALRGAVSDHGGVQLGIGLHGVNAGVHATTARVRSAGGGATRRLYDGVAVSMHGGEERTVFRSRRDERVADVRVSGVLADEPGGAPSLLGAEGGASARALRAQLDRALEDPLTRGVLLDLRGVGGMAQIEEMRPRLEKLKAAGKPVVAFLEYGGGRGDLFLSSAASRVVASDDASFGPLGLRVEKRYWKQPLAKAGVRVDRSSIGKYKSAYREFSVDSIPPADSLVIEHTLDTVQEMFVAAVEKSRGVPRGRFVPLLDGREYESRDLVAAGLVDSVGYREDALRVLGQLTGLGAKPRALRLGRVPQARRAWTVPSRVAVVYASGGITLGRSGNDLLEGRTLGHQTLIAQMERACRNPAVRAVVLRVDSPGGLSLASGLMAHAIERLKRETKKPIVVSMAGTAASGGYDLACNADWIVANRFTRTGSIGVLFVKPSWGDLYRRIGVHEDVFARGDYTDGWSTTQGWDARLQAAADSSIGRTYDRFVRHVASGRRLGEAAVREVAQGRVWLGDDAKERRLVDAIGGLDEAIAEARRRAKVPEGERIRPVEYLRPRGGFVERLVGSWMRESLSRELSLRSLQGGVMLRDDLLDALPE